MQFGQLQRREFITLVGYAAAWPLAARAQQRERMRRVGVLVSSLAAGPPAVASLQQSHRSVPIVFANVSDPVGNAFVASLARPGGNTTGFMQFEYGLSAKWLELLKEIAPRVTRAAVLRDPAISSGLGQFGAIQAVAPSLGLDVSPVDVRDVRAIERAVGAIARQPNGGLIVTGSASAVIHRDLIITLAAQHKLPAVYFQRHFVAAGGLISYGADLIDEYRRAAAYVDRILKGENPADLPVQAPKPQPVGFLQRSAFIFLRPQSRLLSAH